MAIDGATGSERWRYQCDQRPAFRGLTYWKSDTLKQPRLLFNAGDWLYALDADSGQPLETFGNQGRVKTGHFRVAPAIFQDLILIAGYDGDAFAFDFHTGEKKWTFHTRPHEGEWGHETWSALEAGANCWVFKKPTKSDNSVIVKSATLRPSSHPINRRISRE